MTGTIISLPPLVEQPPGNNASNPAGLPGITYVPALLNVLQTWGAKQTFPLGNISLNAADILGLASSATTDTTNAANITSGTLPAARLPNPTASTLGGVQSIAAVSHNWINSISTSGVPSLSQPAFSDISGTLALATQVSGNLAVANLNGGTSASSSTYWRGDGTWAAAPIVSFNSLTGAVTTSVVVQKFTASGTYTPTAGMLHAIIECIGGGGGGGGVPTSTSNSVGAGGGGSGSPSRAYVTAAQVGASKAVVIGTAGAGGTAGANPGTAGGDTSVGALCIAKGGSGGGAGVSGGSATGGAGGVVGTGDVAGTGEPGTLGFGFTGLVISGIGGDGGSTQFGGGARGPQSVSVAAGNTGTGFGSGGSGAAGFNSASTAAGGAGAPGIVIITEFVNL